MLASDIKSLKQIHARIIIERLDQNMFVATKLVMNYAMCSCLENARLVFDKIERRDGFLWNCMIRGCSRNGQCEGEEIVTLYNQMHRDGFHPDNFTFPFVLKACAPREGKAVHSQLLRYGYESDVQVGNALIDMYAKCGQVQDAWQVFEKMCVRDVVSWTALIVGCARNGRCKDAFSLFTHMLMESEKAKPDAVTMSSVLRACTHFAGKGVHAHVIRRGFEADAFVRAGLIDMYANSGSIEAARRVFDIVPGRDVVLWNAMIKGYLQNGYVEEGLTFFSQMLNSDVTPNSVTMLTVLPACARADALHQGKQIHGYIVKNGLQSDVAVSNSLIGTYGRCGRIEAARHLFDKMSKRNVVSWNAMIAAYTLDGLGNEALTLFNQMQMAHMKPNLVTMVCVLSACAHLGALQQGKWIHDYINRNGFESDVSVGTALIDMYAKCGNVEAAGHVFDNMFKRSVVTWSAMIDGYGMHGQGEQALAVFSQMQEAGMKPNNITFICVLSACSHAGLVDEGLRYFHSMSRDYCITPNVKHYTCIVDLLGRAGQLNEARDLIAKMPIKPNAGVWGALLSACRIHCNVELAENVARHLFVLDPERVGYYVLLSNIYAAAERWDGVSKVRKSIKDMGFKTTLGSSFIEVNNRIYTFPMGDKSCTQYENAYAMLETWAGQMEEAGYVPDTKLVLLDVKEEAGYCFWAYQYNQ